MPAAKRGGEPSTPTLPEVFRAELTYVWSTLRRLGIREPDLEDLAHEVFVTVHQRLADYDPSRPIRPWLFGIALKKAARHKSRAARERGNVDGEADVERRPDNAPSADEQLASRERRERVLEALSTLDLDRRAVLILHDLDEVPMPEVAQTLSIGLNTAYSRLRLARQQFRITYHRMRLQRGDA